MKKALALILVLTLICGMTTATAEVVLLSEPGNGTSAGNTGSLEDMKVGETYDLDDRTYTIVLQKTLDYVDSTWTYLEGKSSSESEWLVLWIDVLNFTNQSQTYFKDAEISVTYEGERGTYVFGGNIFQAKKSQGWPNNQQDDFNSIPQLQKGYYVARCAVPNYVIENPGELRMDITTGGITLTYYFRK